MQKRIMILGAGILQVPVINKTKELGYYSLVIDGDEKALGLPLADKSIVADITDPEKMLQIAMDEKIDGVIHPCSEVAMNSMGYINERLNLSGLNREVIKMATNKEYMRKAFEEYGAPSPHSYCISDFKYINDVLGKLQDDFIIKPSRSSGSRGVTKLNKQATLISIQKAFERALDESRDHSVIIEDFINGPEFSVEIIIWNSIVHVLAVTDKKTTEDPYFVELGHSQPSRYPEVDINKIKDAAVRGVKALKLNNCAAHAELKLSPNGPYIMEIGARLGGDFISTELVHLSTGIDMVAAAINVSLGVQPNWTSNGFSRGVAIRYFTPKPGIVTKIENLQLAKQKYIYDFKIYKKVGDVVQIVKSSGDRSGHVITLGDSPEEAIKEAEYIINNINIITI